MLFTRKEIKGEVLNVLLDMTRPNDPLDPLSRIADEWGSLLLRGVGREPTREELAPHTRAIIGKLSGECPDYLIGEVRAFLEAYADA